MKNLLTALLIVLIAACSSPTETEEEKPEEPETEVIGTWELSEDGSKADWIGESQSKAKADTMLFETPNGNTLEMIHQGENDLDTSEDVIDLTYIDSTITQQTVDDNYLDLNRTEFTFKGVEVGPKPFRINKKWPSVDEQALSIEIQFLYSCGSGEDDVDEVHYTIKNRNGDAYETDRLVTKGFRQVIESKFCD